MKAISSQRKQLYRLFGYSKETEAMHVKQITGDEGKTTAADLTMTQASQLIKSLTTNWGMFDMKKNQHMYVLSLLRQIGWTKASERYGTIPDIARLSKFLKSNKSPVCKPLQSMDKEDLTKLINCLESMLGKKYAKR